MIQTFQFGLFQESFFRKEYRLCNNENDSGPSQASQVQTEDNKEESADLIQEAYGENITEEILHDDVQKVIDALDKNFKRIIPDIIIPNTHRALFAGTTLDQGNTFFKQFKDLREVTASAFRATGETTRKEHERLIYQERVLEEAKISLEKRRTKAIERKKKVLALRQLTRQQKSLLNPTRWTTDKVVEGIENWHFNKSEIAGVEGKIQRVQNELTKTTTRAQSIEASMKEAFKKHFASRDAIVSVFESMFENDFSGADEKTYKKKFIAEQITRAFALGKISISGNTLSYPDDIEPAELLTAICHGIDLINRSISDDMAGKEQDFFIAGLERFKSRGGEKAMHYQRRTEAVKTIKETKIKLDTHLRIGHTKRLKDIKINGKRIEGDFKVTAKSDTHMVLMRTDTDLQHKLTDVIVMNTSSPPPKYRYAEASDIRNNSEIKKLAQTEAKNLRENLINDVKKLDEKVTNFSFTDKTPLNIIISRLERRFLDYDEYCRTFQITEEHSALSKARQILQEIKAAK